MTKYEGYGIDTSVVNYKDDACNILWNMTKDTPWVKEAYENYCEDNNLHKGEESQEAFIKDYERDVFDSSSGIEAFIADYLSNGNKRPYVYDDYVIHIPATLPKDEEERNKLMTTTEIDKQIIDIFKPIVREDFKLNIGWHTITA